VVSTQSTWENKKKIKIIEIRIIPFALWKKDFFI